MFEAAMGGSGGAGFSPSALFCPWVIDHDGERFMHVDTGEFIAFEEVGLTKSEGIAFNSLGRFSRSGDYVYFNVDEGRNAASSRSIAVYHTKTLRKEGEIVLPTNLGNLLSVCVSDDGMSLAVISQTSGPHWELSFWTNWEERGRVRLTTGYGTWTTSTNLRVPKIIERNNEWLLVLPDSLEVSSSTKGLYTRTYNKGGDMTREVYTSIASTSTVDHYIDTYVIGPTTYFRSVFDKLLRGIYMVNEDLSLTLLSDPERSRIDTIWRLPERRKVSFEDVVFTTFVDSPDEITLPFPVFDLQLTDKPQYVLPLSSHYREGLLQANYFLSEGSSSKGQLGVFNRKGEPVITGRSFSPSGDSASRGAIGLPILWRQ